MEYLDDASLLSAIRSGDEKAFEYLFRTYFPRLKGYALRFVENNEAADDIVQECFLKFWEKRAILASTSLTSLLFAIVRNSCLNYLKHLCVVENFRLDYLAKCNGEERLYHSDFHCLADSPLLHEELQKEIKTIIDSLPRRCRQVFLMSRFQHLKNREIAEKLQISTTAVEKHIAKALGVFSKHFIQKYPLDIAALLLAWAIG